MIPDLDRVAAIIREVAEAEILPRFRRPDTQEVREKGPGDLVTIADEQAERALTRRLAELLPGSVVVGEEAVAANPAVLDRIAGPDPVWIVDPVDGTANFVAGNPKFGVIVALAQGGRTLAGWIHDPCTGRTLMGAAGQGAWMEGRRLRAAAPVPASAMEGIVNARFFDKPVRARLLQGADRINRHFSQRCSAHDYLLLVAGEAHFGLSAVVKPWDHAAGVLLHAEAGGWSAKLDGSRYAPTDRDGGLLLAPVEAGWRELKSVLLD